MKIAKLFIKGMRVPLELTENQGLQAKSIKEDINILNSETVDIGDTWTGEKGDIRFIIFENVAEYKDESKFSNQELRDFEEELRPYFLKETDSEFMDLVNSLVKDIIADRKMFCSTEMLKQIKIIRDLHLKEEDIIEKAKEMIRDKYIGTLTKTGEMRYLIDKRVIKMNDDGKDFSVIQNSDKTIPYNDLNNKLCEYSDYKSRIAYAKQMDVKRLEETAEQMGVESEQEF